jgi:hypothetical protein
MASTRYGKENRARVKLAKGRERERYGSTRARYFSGRFAPETPDEDGVCGDDELSRRSQPEGSPAARWNWAGGGV